MLQSWPSGSRTRARRVPHAVSSGAITLCAPASVARWCLASTSVAAGTHRYTPPPHAASRQRGDVVVGVRAGQHEGGVTVPDLGRDPACAVVVPDHHVIPDPGHPVQRRAGVAVAQVYRQPGGRVGEPMLAGHRHGLVPFTGESVSPCSAPIAPRRPPVSVAEPRPAGQATRTRRGHRTRSPRSTPMARDDHRCGPAVPCITRRRSDCRAWRA